MQQSLFAMAVPTEEKIVSTDSVLNTPLSDTVFTVVDVETTGLSAKKNALTEVVAIQYKNGQEIAMFSSLVKPTEPIPPEVIAITGIDNDMVQNAPAAITVLSDLCSFMGTAPVIVGHNVGFDINFIGEKIDQNGLSSFRSRLDLNRAVCTKALAVKAMPGLPSYEGIVVATACGIDNPNPHRAEYDVRMSAGILFALIDKLRQQNPNIKTLKDLVEYQGPLG